MNPIKLEVDDDTIMDFIASTANLRASIYGIPQADKFKVFYLPQNSFSLF